ncbi:biotin-dependent carboxyltransferase family protein [Shewanella sp. GXUN23E]|uniref:5-oxoprolinase subunit C family protein n=1 Tax=Shewanella sp. GXUN23E TaxID=3422498 RepID=UPI003D7F10FA
MSALEVISPGPLTLLQDVGRFGGAQLGLSQGGPMDLHAYCWANRLLGNPMSAAVLEITLGNASFVARQDMTLALCGADMSASAAGKPQANWRSFQLRAGQQLKLGMTSQGVRSYLAVAGGFQTPVALGSRATVLRNKLGGLNGEKVASGELLTVSKDSHTKVLHKVPDQFQPDYSQPVCLSLLPGAQHADFDEQTLSALLSGRYRISPQSDRMGIRLEGPPVSASASAINAKGMISEGITMGAMQLPPDGQPIVLMSDRQTLGGYPKPFSLSRRAQWRLAQCMPGTEVSFCAGDLQLALRQWQDFVRFFNLWPETGANQ